MTESEVVKAIRKQRDEIARNELDTLRRMARLWVPSYRYLQEQVSALMRIIQDKRDKGEAVEMEYIYSLKRYRTMMEQAAVTIRKYNKAIAGLINGAEAEATDLGQKNAQQLVSIAEPDHEMWTRVNRRETTIAAGMTAEGAPLDSLLKKSFGQMKEGLEQALITGISTGQGSSWIADQIMQAAAIPERRALLIARTEVNRAYRQSNWNQMRSSRAVLGYRRMCHKGTACFACLMLDKEFYPVDEEPTDHPNGKCSFVPVTRHFDPGNDPTWQGGREYFDSLPEEAQRKLMGPGRFDLWKQSGVDPRDMVWIKPNKTWGGSPAIKPLGELNFTPTVSMSTNGAVKLSVNFFDRHKRITPEAIKSLYRDAIKKANKQRQSQPIPAEEPQKLLPIWDPYKVAKEGGANSKLLKRAETMTNKEIEDSIKSLQKRIDEHNRKPEALLQRLSQGGEVINRRATESLLVYWPNEVVKYTAQRDIFRSILKDRGENE